MSIIWMTFAIPAIAARHPDPVKGSLRMVAWFLTFLVIYYYYVAYGHTRFFVPHG